jgi:hypothetical protein
MTTTNNWTKFDDLIKECPECEKPIVHNARHNGLVDEFDEAVYCPHCNTIIATPVVGAEISIRYATCQIRDDGELSPPWDIDEIGYGGHYLDYRDFERTDGVWVCRYIYSFSAEV